VSTLDQPLLIANSNYHVGHQIAIFVAEEQGFFREEKLGAYQYDAGGWRYRRFSNLRCLGRSTKSRDGKSPKRVSDERARHPVIRPHFFQLGNSLPAA
jgi:hypothetical protein